MRKTKKVELETIKDKSTLVKLLAEEDLTVNYQKVQTASFNVKTREVTLPIWKDKSEDVADMMSLHEVGHALYTPEDMIKKGEEKEIKHSFLNVLEDVRIEKMIQDKYLGSKKIFKKAYTELIEKDFFGVNGKDLNLLNLIDRINMHYKNVPDVSFDKDELPWVKKANQTKTPDDVIQLAYDLQKWMKSQDKNQESDPLFELDIQMSKDGDTEKPEDEQNPSSSLDSNNQEESEDDEETKTSGSGDAEDDGKDKEEEELGLGKGIGDNDDSKINGIQAITDDNYKKKQFEAVDENATMIEHLNIPKISLKDVIVDYTEINKELTTHYNQSCSGDKDNQAYMDWVKKDIKRYQKDQAQTISYMVKEFEMKKAADLYKRSTISKTGNLNMDKLHSYSYNEDIFLKMNNEPGATNHGLVMFVDWSGSMAENFHNTLKQTLNLVWFCQRVNIPFEVYGFTNGYSRRDDTNKNIKIQKRNQNDMIVNEVTLLNMLSSRASKSEFEEGLVNFWAISNYWDNRYGLYESKDRDTFGYPIYVPSNFSLHSTPLNHSIVVAMDLIPKFKKDNGLQKVHTVFLTDGYSNSIRDKYKWDKTYTSTENGDKVDEGYKPTSINHRDRSIILKDPVTNKKWTSTYRDDGRTDYSRMSFQYDSQTLVLLSFLKARVQDMNVVNFFIAGRNRKGTIAKHDIESIFGLGWEDQEKVKQLQKEMRTKNVLVCTNQGWDEMYVLPGGARLDTNQDENELTEIKPGATKGQLKKAFGKMTSGRKNNRPVLNKFIGMIA